MTFVTPKHFGTEEIYFVAMTLSLVFWRGLALLFGASFRYFAKYNRLIFRVLTHIQNEAESNGLPIAAFVESSDGDLQESWGEIGKLEYKTKNIAPFQVFLTSEELPRSAITYKPLPVY